MNETADEAGFLAVYPQGSGRTDRARTFNAGNCCGYAMRQNIDDVKFVDRLLDELAAATTINPNRVYATGMSNGAMLCYRLADELSERIAAIAPVSGTMGKMTCSPKRPVAVCHFHGTDDQFVRYEGGFGPRSLTRTQFYSVQHTIDAWVAANGCDRTPVVEELPVKVEDGTRVTRISYRGGRDGTEVVLYRIEGGGHTWPGRPARLRFLGKTTQNLFANKVIWEFFQQHARR